MLFTSYFPIQTACVWKGVIIQQKIDGIGFWGFSFLLSQKLIKSSTPESKAAWIIWTKQISKP